MWSYTGCHLQNRASDGNSKNLPVKGEQELSATSFFVGSPETPSLPCSIYS